MCDCATQCDLVFTAEQADPPLSGKNLDTIDRALGIIELQYRPCPGAGAPLLEAQPKQPIRQLLLEPLIVDPGCTLVSPPLDDAPITLSEITCMPPAPLLVDAPLALKEVSYNVDYLPDAATTEVANGRYYVGGNSIGEDITNSADFAALEERFAKLDTDHDLVIAGKIQIEKRISALEKDIPPTDTLAEPGPCEADGEAPFNPAQLAVLSEDINTAVSTFLDPLLDRLIAKVSFLTDSNVQNTIGPIFKVLNSRLHVIEAVPDECEDEEDTGGPLAQGEVIGNAIVQKSMREYPFRQNTPDEPNLVHGLHDPNLMQPGQFKQNADKLQLVHN